MDWCKNQYSQQHNSGQFPQCTASNWALWTRERDALSSSHRRKSHDYKGFPTGIGTVSAIQLEKSEIHFDVKERYCGCGSSSNLFLRCM